ncbi:type II secretion system F family protein [Qipengyuania sp.]|uniref:type II secretion system F family protein n=1 Tax=Qipengyuania sp. TaxID=2004515 RepID=UPI0035C7FEB4
MIQLMLVAVGIVVMCGLGYAAFAGPSTGKAGSRRLKQIRYRHSESAEAKVESQLKKAIAARKPAAHHLAGSGSRVEAIAMRLDRTGKGWTLTQYAYSSAGVALAVALLIYLKTSSFALSLAICLGAGAGIPHFVVNKTITRRTAKFNAKFADAIELLVRGLRSGLPVAETLQVVSQEVPGPVGEEFKAIVDRTRVGRTLEESLQVAADKLGIPEFNFFCITLAIQRETGGNLAETLSNLADVLRKRAQMKLKIKAMSSESKASAMIVGALPFIVFGLITWINPGYTAQFFTEERLIVAGLGGGIWMGLGVFIMAKMVSFEI